MIHNFDTKLEIKAVAALLVYTIYRSRDKRKFKINPEMWGLIERYTKASAKRARNLAQFVEALKPRLCTPSINPRWVQIGMKGRVLDLGDGTFFESGDSEQREFLTDILEHEQSKDVLNVLYKESTHVILLVRDRLEREKPLENKLNEQVGEEESL